MHPQFETFKKLEFNMVDRMYRDSSGSSMPGVANPSGLFPNLSLSLDGVMSNPGLPNASSSMLPFPYCNLQELISGTKQLQNVNQDFSVGTFDAITHAALMADLNQKISEVERKLLLPTRTHPDQTTLNLESCALDRDMDSRFTLKGELSKLLSLHSKHPLSSSCTEPAFKRTRTGEYSKIDSIDIGVVVPLSTSELKATFPLPPLKSNVRRPPRVKLSSTLKEVWEKFEKMSDAMDDTASDQEAFVKKLFVRSLHRSGLSHLTERIQKSKSNAVCDGGRKK